MTGLKIKNMRIPLMILPVMIIGSFAVSAQDITEAYNLSNLTTQGTARSMGFGNTLGSVGGDFSSLSVNPAGLGVYRSSELSFTPALKINSATGDYAGTSASDNNTRFGVNQFAIVLTNAPKGKRYDKRDWKTVSFAFGMNRVADFNRNYTYSGHNNTSSASQVFESDANLYPGDDTIQNTAGYLGYQSYLLNQDKNGVFSTVVPFAGGINQVKSVQERGSINEYVLSLAGNYKEKLMLGATIGIPSVEYTRNSYYTETVDPGNKNNPDAFSTFTYGSGLKISGNGVNAKLGAIYKFSDLFRAGIAFHTPTYYSISDYFDPLISATAQGYNSVLTVDNWLQEQQFDYHISTPWKTILSATIMLNKFGFITADYEYVDYSSTRYHFPAGVDNYGQSYQQAADFINREIKKTYTGVSNFRLGGEGRINKQFMVRAGFGYYGDPYTSYGKSAMPAAYTTQRIDVSLGVGFRFRYFFTDLGFVHSMYQGYEQPYAVDYSGVVSGPAATVPTAKISYALNNLAWTIGLKF